MPLEKSFKELNPNIRLNYERGYESFKNGDFNAAIHSFQSVLSAEPGCLDVRKALRATQTKKFKSGGSASFKKMGAMFTGMGSMMKGQMAAAKNPAEAMSQAENMLSDDPTSQSALNMLAAAAEEAEYFQTAAWVFDEIHRLSPTDINHLRRMAKFYMRPDVRNGAKALEIYEKICQMRPNDQEATKGMKDAAATGSITGGGWESASSYRDVIKNKDLAVSLEQASKAVKSDDMITQQINETLAKIQNDPNNLVHYRTIGNLYTQKFEFDEALKYMEVALKATGGDPSLESAMADTQRRKLDHQIETKKGEMAKTPSDVLKAEIEALEKAKVEFQIQDAERRRERYPNDLDIRYDVGKLYFEVGRINEAIKEFQLAQRNPKIRLQTLNYIGLCFMQKGIVDLAADQFKKAISEHPLLDNLKKELYYNLGLAYERQKKMEEAIGQFKKIMEADFSYKDVAQKIEDYYNKKAGEDDGSSPPTAQPTR